MEKRDFRSLGPEAQETLRRAAVAAVLEGESRLAVARRFGVTRQAAAQLIERRFGLRLSVWTMGGT